MNTKCVFCLNDKYCEFQNYEVFEGVSMVLPKKIGKSFFNVVRTADHIKFELRGNLNAAGLGTVSITCFLGICPSIEISSNDNSCVKALSQPGRSI